MKCDICSAKIGMTFLGKILGTYFKDANGKQKVACNACQSKFRSKEELLSALK